MPYHSTVAEGRRDLSLKSMAVGSVILSVINPRILNVHATPTRFSKLFIEMLSTNPPSPPPANTKPFAKPLLRLKN
jgi:hypothetical protein